MRSCPKCGSYLPEGKAFCQACGRLNLAVTKSARDSLHSEKVRTHTRIQNVKREVERDAWRTRKQDHPYQGDPYEQHQSHDPYSPGYYRPKSEGTGAEQSQQMGVRIICAAAYFGVLFFLPLVLLRGSKEGKFHANQGLNLFLLNLVLGALTAGFLGISYLFDLISIPLMIYGVSNALRGKMAELPVIGKLRLIKDDENGLGGRRY